MREIFPGNPLRILVDSQSDAINKLDFTVC